MDRRCLHCSKRYNTYPGLTKHLLKCKARLRNNIGYKQHHANGLPYGLENTGPAEHTIIDCQGGEILQDNNGAAYEEPHVACSPSAPSSTTFAEIATPVAEANYSGVNVSAGEQTHPKKRSGLQSVTSQLRDVGFEMGEGVKAGEAVPSAQQRPYKVMVEEVFKSEFGYAFTTWLQRIGCSKGDVRQLLDDTRLAPLHAMLPYTNAEQWEHVLCNISYSENDTGWTKHDIQTRSGPGETIQRSYYILYQDVVAVMAFLIGHRPFAPDMTYAPVQTFNDEFEPPQRVYHELHSADWWWETQASMPPGATVVPVIISVDKTQLTKLQGDAVAWPVYMTIGNLSRSARRGRATPGTILVGFLPIVNEKGGYMKSRVYHFAMEHIFKRMLSSLLTAPFETVLHCSKLFKTVTNSAVLAFETLAVEGIILECADGLTRCCYPVICAVLADYEEQVLLTGVKSGRHCTRCRVAPDRREDLTGQTFEWRTKGFTQQQQQKQVLESTNRSHEDYIHPVANFAWRHPLLNLHRSMPTDILHLLMKGIVMHVITWTQLLLDDKIPATRNAKNAPYHDISCASGSAQLDERFRQIPRAHDLKLFNGTPFSEISQWTGSEQRDVVRQFVAAVTPLLVDRAPFALQFIRALCDLVTIANYKTHDKNTIAYLESAIRRMDVLKEEFRPYRAGKQINGDLHFNFPKWHALVHIPHDIKAFGGLDGMCTGANSEAHHIDMVKDFYSLTNKKDYLLQICRHNARRDAMLAIDHEIAFENSRIYGSSDRELVAQVAKMSEPIRMKDIGWTQNMQCLHGTTISVAEAAERLQYRDMIDAIAVFVREQRRRRKGEVSTDADMDRREEDSSWAGRLRLKIHPSMTCWRPSGRIYNDPEHREKEIIRCAPNWHGSGLWRKDNIWVQEHYTPDQHHTHNGPLMGGRVSAQLQLIMTLIENSLFEGRGRPVEYNCVLVEALQPVDKGAVHLTHGMITVRRWPVAAGVRHRTLKGIRVYEAPAVIRSAHLIPRNLPVGGQHKAEVTTFLINNYVDWDEYNRWYDGSFEREWDRMITRYIRTRAGTTTPYQPAMNGVVKDLTLFNRGKRKRTN